MKATHSHLSHKCIIPIEVGIRVEAIFEVDLGIIMPIGDVQGTVKISEVGPEVILTIEVIMDITHRVVRGIITITVIIEEIIIEVKVKIEIGVGH